MTRNAVSRNDSTLHSKFSRALKYQRIFARVAGRLGVSRSHVYQVATGTRRSKRVESALLREIERVENENAA
ncbi:MAG TPA: hypothetical protein VN622_09045 [Clostridia bacterium]|nr:hypothetical protein [Clostridia bacterium]